MAPLILFGTDNIFQMPHCTAYSNHFFLSLDLGNRFSFRICFQCSFWKYLVPYIYFAVHVNETAIWNKP